MTEVKSLSITADSYRHRGWVWNDRGVYELFKPHMKLPLWIDRILINHASTALYAVGKTDGLNNAVYLGDIERGVLNIPEEFPERLARYHCRIHPDNGFRVLAERIRAKKPDVDKAPRPHWRQPMSKPWEPGTLGGAWVVDRKFVKEVSTTTPPPPPWADRLWVSTSGGTDTFVWVNSKAYGKQLGNDQHKALAAAGIGGHQRNHPFKYDNIWVNPHCHWQLAGVRKKTVWVPEPEVVKPSPDTQIAANLNITRAEAKLRAFRDAYQPPTVLIDFANLERRMLSNLAHNNLGTPKPPVGVKPRNLHDEERANALDEAMVRHLNEDLPFPIEWAVEWNELRARLNKEQK